MPPSFREPLGLFVEHIVIQNDSVTFNCDARGKPSIDFLWMRVGYGEIEPNQRNPSIESNGRYLSLRRVQEDHAGNYSCLVSNIGGRKKRIFQLLVITPPTIQQGTGTEEVVTREYAHLQLNCTALGYPAPRVIWYKDNVLIGNVPHENTKEEPIYNFNKETKSLIILSPTKEEMGTYTCKVQNKAGVITKDYIVKVLIPPRFIGDISQETETITQEVATRLILHCFVVGYPKPVITWFHNNIKLHQTGQQQRVDFLNDRQRLIISSVALEDQGSFDCTAQNRIGAVSKQYILKTISEFQFLKPCF